MINFWNKTRHLQVWRESANTSREAAGVFEEVFAEVEVAPVLVAEELDPQNLFIKEDMARKN